MTTEDAHRYDFDKGKCLVCGECNNEGVCDPLVCEDCGGLNIEVDCWVDANTDEVKSEGPCDDVHCADCEQHTGMIRRSEFLKKVTP